MYVYIIYRYILYRQGYMYMYVYMYVCSICIHAYTPPTHNLYHQVAQAIKATDPEQFLTDAVTYIEGLGPMGYLYFSAIYVVAEMFAIPAVPLTASAGYLFGVGPGAAASALSELNLTPD